MTIKSKTKTFAFSHEKNWKSVTLEATFNVIYNVSVGVIRQKEENILVCIRFSISKQFSIEPY